MTKRKTAIVILAAGAGRRMKSERAKVLHPIAGRPMIAYVLEAARALAPERMVTVIAPGMEDVAAAVRPVPVAVQSEPRGTAHAVLAARQAVEGFSGDVLVLFADTPLITAATCRQLMATLDGPEKPAVAVLAMRLDRALAAGGGYGRLVTGKDGELLSITEAAEITEITEITGIDAETGAMTLCNSGVMAVRGGELFDLLDQVGDANAQGEFYLTDIVAAARQKGLACTYREADAAELQGVNSRADLARAEAAMQDILRARAMAGGASLADPHSVWFSFDTVLGRDAIIGPHVVFGTGVRVGNGAHIRAFSHMEGAEIGAGAVIGPHARLRPGTRIAERAEIGSFVEVKNAVIGKGAKAHHLSYLGDAVIGEKANIGAGTITCNYDGFAKHQTEIGEGVFVGSNSALVAPVKIGQNAIIAAGSVITKDVKADALALGRAQQVNKAGGAKKYRDKKKKG